MSAHSAEPAKPGRLGHLDSRRYCSRSNLTDIVEGFKLAIMATLVDQVN